MKYWILRNKQFWYLSDYFDTNLAPNRIFNLNYIFNIIQIGIDFAYVEKFIYGIDYVRKQTHWDR